MVIARLIGVAALGGLLFGYDTAVVAGVVIYLREDFGLSPAAVGWTVSAALVGAAFGAAFAGRFSDRFGRKAALYVAAILFLITAIGSALAGSLTMLLAMRAIGGIGVGIVSVVPPLYIAEVSPAHLRGRLVSVHQLSIVTGMLLVSLVNFGIATSGTEEWDIAYGWRWMFASQAVPALVLFCMLFVVPESPRWLFYRGQRDRARSVLTSVLGTERAEAALRDLDSVHESTGRGAAGYRSQWFRRLILIGIGVAVLQQITGINVIIYFAPQIFLTVAGAAADVALLETVIIGVANLAFTLVAVFTVDRLGRRALMLIGFSGMAVCIAVVGLGIYSDNVGPLLLFFVIAYVAFFALSVGPVTWVIISEMFPGNARGLAVGIATTFNWLANILVSQTFPQMDANPWLVANFNHAFPFFLYAAFAVLAAVFIYRFVPENTGRSLEQIEAAMTDGETTSGR